MPMEHLQSVGPSDDALRSSESPFVPSRPSSVAVQVTPPGQTVPRGARVLVVDDDGDGVELMTELLQRDGHVVRGFTSPLAALEAVSSLEGNFDVVVTDIGMVEMSGLELCERMLGVRPDLPVIVNTGHNDIDTAVSALRVGAFDFLTKPVNPKVLALRVAHAVRQRRFSDELGRLRLEVRAGAPAGMIGSGAAMRRVYDLVARVASSDASVLVQGETGTGKELVARAIHEAGPHKDGPFVALNCAAVPSALLESELFGHAKGAFTDAKLQRTGLFRQAEGGTLFLDEIGELPLDMQAKLLRALQERRVRPVGSDQEVPFDARVLAATNRNLEDEVEAKRFREDLYYRVAVVKIDLPPLRDRGGDVIELARHCLTAIGRRTGSPVPSLSSAVAEKVMGYTWPGNVRELENAMERAMALARAGEITVDDLPQRVRTHQSDRFVVAVDRAGELIAVEEVERRYIVRALALLGGNKTRAAEVLGIDRRTLYRKLDRWGVGDPGVSLFPSARGGDSTWPSASAAHDRPDHRCTSARRPRLVAPAVFRWPISPA